MNSIWTKSNKWLQIWNILKIYAWAQKLFHNYYYIICFSNFIVLSNRGIWIKLEILFNYLHSILFNLYLHNNQPIWVHSITPLDECKIFATSQANCKFVTGTAWKMVIELNDTYFFHFNPLFIPRNVCLCP